MASSLTGIPKLKVYACPHCSETINTTMQRCTFCSRLINPEQAAQAAAEMSHISAACNEASLLKIATTGEGIQILIRTFIHSTLFGKLENLTLLSCVILVATHWWIKYGDIQTTDPDYAPATKSVTIITAAAVILLPVVILMSFIL
jgi:hypothetical protein